MFSRSSSHIANIHLPVCTSWERCVEQQYFAPDERCKVWVFLLSPSLVDNTRPCQWDSLQWKQGKLCSIVMRRVHSLQPWYQSLCSDVPAASLQCLLFLTLVEFEVTRHEISSRKKSLGIFQNIFIWLLHVMAHFTLTSSHHHYGFSSFILALPSARTSRLFCFKNKGSAGQGKIVLITHGHREAQRRNCIVDIQISEVDLCPWSQHSRCL